MAGRDYLKGHASTSKAPGNDTAWSGENAGPYIGVVKNNIDPLRMGRLKVNIPGLSKTTDPISGNLITCEYLSPFYGAKDVRYNLPGSTKYEHSQHSYGFWAVPPDIGTRVLVIFAEGKMDQAFWIGCVQEPMTNHMVPGIAASEKTWDKSSGGAAGQFSSDVDKQSTYGTTVVPAGEVNRSTPGLTATNYNSINKPIHPFAETLLKQGLSADDIRGNTSSSARRETPSQVFGISTPGRKDISTTRQKVGTKDSEATDYVSRTTGHTFVMDDGAVDGTNQLTRLRTASGHQLLMHDTEGVVYIANGSGNAYIEMQKNGRIDVYSGVGGINFRTEGDFNLHSDSNINMHANGQIRMSSAREMIQSADAILTVGEKGILQSSPAGGIQAYAKSSISSFTPGQQLHGASGQFHLQGSQVHFNMPMGRPGSGGGGGIDKWGPTWLTKDKVGMQLREEGDVELAHKGVKPLKEFTRKTKTTVHRFVTHEPMFRASVINSDGIIPVDADDKKQWSRLANTPGTPEYVNNRNRLSENSAIRDAQYQADALQWVKQKIGDSTDATKAKQLLTEFGTKYNEIYGISEKINLPFDIKDSISEKFKGIDFNSPLKDLTSNLTSQVVDSFTGKSKDLFKDNVFVNSAGELFTLGSNTVSGVTGNIDLLNSSLNSVQGLTKNLSAGNIPATISNLQSISQTYTSVVGGQIVGMNQIKSLATKAGLFNSSAAQLQGQTFLQNIGQNISANIGSIAGSVKGFFTSKFSDRRLKEDIQLIGKSPAGINIYSFKYKHTNGTYEGVMAQEVPWARTMTHTGFYAVDYSKVDVEFRRLH
jgi:hypothetical protein